MQVKVSNQSHIEKQPGCVAAALSVLGNKWTSLIVMELTQGSTRFSTLEKKLPKISPRTLSQRLHDLEEHQLITKQSYAEVPPRVEYSLTQKGLDLIPIIKSMADWGDKHHN